MQHEVSISKVLEYVFKMIRPFYFSIFIMVLVGVSWAVNVSLTPYLLKIILNRLPEGSSSEVLNNLFWPVTFYLLTSLWVATVFRLYGHFVELKMIPKLRNKIYKETVQALLGQSHQYYQNNFAGSLTNKINDLRKNIPEIIQVIIDRFFSHTLAFVVATYTLWTVNPKFALAMLVWVIGFAIFAYYASRKLVILSGQYSETRSHITGRVVDALSNILSVKLFARKNKETEGLNTDFESAMKAEQNLQKLYQRMWIVLGYSFVLVQALNMYFLIRGRVEGWITVGDFALVLALNTAIVDFLWQLTHDFSSFSQNLGEIAQALRAILVIPDIVDSPNAKVLNVGRGEIIFKNVKFYYKSQDILFDNQNIKIKAGEKVGLVGYSGSGKTTFVNLILRLFDINDGQILIDGQNIKDITQESLRNSIAMIPQDPSLFHRTLIENIRYARVEATNEEVIEAAKKANAHEFIIKQANGYDSMVGERGIKLSGGQRQRIAIARAILKNAPILMLDEATSQLDSLTEHKIQKALWSLMEGKTTIVVAHRLSTLMHMDRILVFEKGKIVEDGTHESLLKKGGLYNTMWEAQVAGFLPE